MTARILIAEDSATQALLLQEILREAVPGVECEVAATGAAFLRTLAQGPWHLCLIDLGLPDISGFELLERVVGTTEVPAVVVTASESVQDAVKAMQGGAVDYVTKPVEASRLAVTVRNSIRLGEQARQIGRLRADLEDALGPTRLLGESDGMKEVRALIRRAAESDVTVLVTGETGTGKELVARALHFGGARKDGPFVDVNSAAMTESLIESELFGHEKGAFTGADQRRPGKFEAAQGGTLFLDEIGDMPMSTQAKILRVLQDGTLYRTGGNKRIDVDVRVVCATNADLEAAIADGTFRRDLYYRISTLVIHVPPLRERLDDVPLLARCFVERAARREKRPAPEVSPAALQALRKHVWPGNVRELEHVMARAVLLSEGGSIEPAHLPRSVTRASLSALRSGAPPSLIEAVEELERRMIVEALDRHGWVKARAARALGITTRMIAYKMDSLGLRRA